MSEDVPFKSKCLMVVEVFDGRIRRRSRVLDRRTAHPAPRAGPLAADQPRRPRRAICLYLPLSTRRPSESRYNVENEE